MSANDSEPLNTDFCFKKFVNNQIKKRVHFNEHSCNIIEQLINHIKQLEEHLAIDLEQLQQHIYTNLVRLQDHNASFSDEELDPKLRDFEEYLTTQLELVEMSLIIPLGLLTPHLEQEPNEEDDKQIKLSVEQIIELNKQRWEDHLKITRKDKAITLLNRAIKSHWDDIETRV
jgi:hypothetical protein